MGVSLFGLVVVFWAASQMVPAQSAVFEATRLEGTANPDLNGIWQALNTANWNIEPHAARAGLATVDGPTGEVPAAQFPTRLGRSSKGRRIVQMC